MQTATRPVPAPLTYDAAVELEDRLMRDVDRPARPRKQWRPADHRPRPRS